MKDSICLLIYSRGVTYASCVKDKCVKIIWEYLARNAYWIRWYGRNNEKNSLIMGGREWVVGLCVCVRCTFERIYCEWSSLMWIQWFYVRCKCHVTKYETNIISFEMNPFTKVLLIIIKQTTKAIESSSLTVARRLNIIIEKLKPMDSSM